MFFNRNLLVFAISLALVAPNTSMQDKTSNKELCQTTLTNFTNLKEMASHDIFDARFSLFLLRICHSDPEYVVTDRSALENLNLFLDEHGKFTPQIKAILKAEEEQDEKEMAVRALEKTSSDEDFDTTWPAAHEEKQKKEK